MEIERLVMLQVSDEEAYRRYRSAMMPLLKKQGGRFTLDVRVSEVLKAPVEGQYNRLFTIRFPDEQSMGSFIGGDEYQKVKKKFFEPSVTATAPFAKYMVIP